MSLRALGNTGVARNSGPTLMPCMENIDNPSDIRVAAIQAFRSIPCNADVSFGFI